MEAPGRQKPVWLRLLFGFLHIGLPAAALAGLRTGGLSPVPYAFVLAAGLTAIASRLVWTGRKTI